MHPDMQKEQFSRAYVQAVAACAGYSWSVPSVDDDSVDMCLHQTDGGEQFSLPDLIFRLSVSVVILQRQISFPIR